LPVSLTGQFSPPQSPDCFVAVAVLASEFLATTRISYQLFPVPEQSGPRTRPTLAPKPVSVVHPGHEPPMHYRCAQEYETVVKPVGTAV
jgi:hypothetical protein